ncbi:Glyoxylase, beta-lactamase superfamily II [Cohaesibacter sp. ES.047]|uniref:MBL fold metallo-hydrolase n=1 Tax=Cohaesibacter sp. ES.047 TaxID=1798205 RepID=UPI000BB69D52|nr:MBL fold metallo-hydrolase [Cohaesibacter sp. ES.047]SNY91846.1 Glyoxylase, beta-lactamase superfamily II [Cohaesibacter sp. ES.047]
MTFSINRRTAMLAAAGVAGSLTLPRPSLAMDHKKKLLPMAKARGFKVGDLEVVALLAGSAPRDNPHGIFGLNVSDETFAEISKANFIGTDMAQFYFTPTLVRSGENVILFDTGLNAAGITAALAEAGTKPSEVTHVVITHMHGDHIGGLMADGAPTFENAAFLTGQIEYDHWSKTDSEGFAKNVKPLAERMSFLSDGDSVAPGISAMLAPGHTPGHMTFMLDSNDQQLLLMADLANHYVWSLAYPDWEVRFDMDKEMAAKSRRKVLGMLATDRIPMIGYHMPFPAAGFVETNGDGFRYVPVSYQLTA